MTSTVGVPAELVARLGEVVFRLFTPGIPVDELDWATERLGDFEHRPARLDPEGVAIALALFARRG